MGIYSRIYFGKRSEADAWPTPFASPASEFRSGESLLQALDQVKVAESAVEAVNVRLPVRCDQNGPDGGDSGGIEGDNLFPDAFLSRRQLQLVNLGGHFAGASQIDGTAVLIPGNGQISRLQAIDGSRIASRRRIVVAFLIGPMPTTDWPSGEITKDWASTPSGEIGVGFPPETSWV